MKKAIQTRVFPDNDQMSREAALEIFKDVTVRLEQNESFVLGMATGNSPIKLYKELLGLFSTYKGSLTKFFTVNLDEYYGLGKENPDSYYQYMMKHFWGPLAEIHSTFHIETQTIIPNGIAADPVEESARYEKAIADLGGIDLQILGIGTNGHIGFNEPGSPGSSRTRLVELAEETIQVNRAHFGGDANKVPKQAYTMGVQTIFEAREIVLLVSGASKAAIMKELNSLNNPTEDIPASFLLNHPNVIIFADQLAISAYTS